MKQNIDGLEESGLYLEGSGFRVLGLMVRV